MVTHCPGRDLAIVTYGTLVNNALEAAKCLARQDVNVSVIRLTRIAPLPVEALAKALAGFRYVLVVEETAAGAGIHEKLAWELRLLCPHCRVDALDLGKSFVTHGSMDTLYRHYGLDAASVAEKIQEVLSNEN